MIIVAHYGYSGPVLMVNSDHIAINGAQNA